MPDLLRANGYYFPRYALAFRMKTYLSLLQQAVDLAHEGEQFCRVLLFRCKLAQFQPSFSRFVIHVSIRAIAGPFIRELRSGSLPTVYVDYTTGT